ncbi:unnamed protein product [Ranitomeya imitator]|uniref:Uncharacterized protein n=1 Tax=Ranitomeya imitator TaxID=111125 RepID=A0ABN9LZZ0_9NEOB|nr:unnamed protein product [Ranitomeya imitator]
MRFKSRYFLCELVLEDPRWRQSITEVAVWYNVKETVARLHGDFGAAACSVGMSVKYLNAYTGIIMLRCRKAFHQLLWSSLPFLTRLENRGQRYPCFINTLHVGGVYYQYNFMAYIISTTSWRILPLQLHRRILPVQLHGVYYQYNFIGVYYQYNFIGVYYQYNFIGVYYQYNFMAYITSTTS